MSKKVLCGYCGGIMELIQESYPDYPELQRYYECYDCGQVVSLAGISAEDYIEPDPDREYDEGEF